MEHDQLVEMLKQSLIKIKTLEALATDYKLQNTIPIAIIGMSCRFPGGANDPENFWSLLQQGFDAVTEVPRLRWNINDYYSDQDEPGKGYARHGAFLNVPVDEFDAQFFQISPTEADMMDPRQRLLLEVAGEALENAGIYAKDLEETLTGVFMGMMHNDYEELLSDVRSINAQSGVGLGGAVLSGRLSYVFGLQGPSVVLDTACSSSLVTVHQACQSLRLGESNLALAGGVNLMLAPYMHIVNAKAHMLAHDGFCKTFDRAADGYVRGEGCAVIVLKRLSDALRDNDHILAVIRGSAVNQDGASSGLTVPNGPAQEQVIHQALAQAQLQPNDIDYIEAHGTGTALGDPIEVNALKNVFSEGRQEPLTIGTVKTNIGHLEAAAGIAGIIKTILALQYGEIPKHLHFRERNPQIVDFREIPAQIPLQPIAWKKRAQHTRRAGISSFGYSGTNAHIILEEAPEQDVSQIRPALPRTVFNRQRYWTEGLIHKANQVFLGEYVHPLLGIRLPEVANQTAVIYEQQLDLDNHALNYLQDHQVFNYILYPGAAFVELLLAAAREILSTDEITLQEMAIERPLTLSSLLSKTQVVINDNQISVYSKTEDEDWLLHAQSQFSLRENDITAECLTLLRKRINNEVNLADFYNEMQELGLQYGENFKTLRRAWKAELEVLVELEVESYDKHYMIYPPVLDGALQALGLLTNEQSIYLPMNFMAIHYYAFMEKNVVAHVRLLDANADWISADITIYADTKICLHIKRFKARKASKVAMEKLLHSEAVASWCYEQIWQEYMPVIDTVDLDKIMTYDARLDDSSITQLSADQLLSFIQDMLSKNLNLKRLNILTENAYAVAAEDVRLNQTQLTGFIKTLILEHPELPIRHIDLDTSNLEQSLFLESINQDQSAEQILVQRADKWYVPRIIPEAGLSVPLGEYRLIKSKSGILEGLVIIEEETYIPQEGEVLIVPHAVGLNFRDVLNAMNLYPGDIGALGGDMAGVVSAVGPGVMRFKVGDAVLGLATGSLSSQAISSEALLIAKPQVLNYANASAIPTVFMTAYLALVKLAKLQVGETILIHAGAGGVGMAAIQIAKYLKAEIITTAGTQKKRAYLKTLGVKHVLDSRNTDYQAQIMQLTQNRGVEVVLNSLTGEGFIAASLACCAERGSFVEISKRDIWSAEEVSQMRPDLTYDILALDTIAQKNPEEVQELLTAVVKLFSQGYLQALSLTEFRLHHAIAAFKYVQQARHIGKVVITLPPVQISFDANASYLITGGLGGIGLELAQYLVEHGAGRIVLSSRHADHKIVHVLKTNNTLIEIKECDVSDKLQVQQLIQASHTKDYPLKGIFHLAGVIDDAPVDKQTSERFAYVFAPKALGAWHLHTITQEMGIVLDYFVLFSSLAALIGSPGQSNYATANSFLDGLAFYRHHRGLNAQTINWGPWREVGMAKYLVAQQKRQGIKPFKTPQALAALSQVLRERPVQIEIVHANWRLMSESLAQVPTWLLNIIEQKTTNRLMQMLTHADEVQRQDLVKGAILQEVRKVLGLSATQVISETKGFFEMGMDSLMALELKNRLQALFSRPLSNTIAFDYPQISLFTQYILKLLGYESKQKNQIDEPQAISDIEQKSEEELWVMASKIIDGNTNE